MNMAELEDGFVHFEDHHLKQNEVPNYLVVLERQNLTLLDKNVHWLILLGDRFSHSTGQWTPSNIV